MSENYLAHYGVLGMKWGVRRSEAQLAKARLKSSQDDHEDYKKARSKTDVESMSDKELKDSISRLQMERQYSQLTQKRVSAGQKFVTGVLIGAATSIASEYTNKYMRKGLQYLGGKAAKGVSKGVDAVGDKRIKGIKFGPFDQ
jgi:hypothetical protein